MRNNFFRYYKPNALLILILILSIAFGYLTDFIYPLINSKLSEPIFQFPTIGSLIILVLKLLNKWGLKTPLIKHLFWAKDISGRYEGEIEYRHFESDTICKKQCALEITQTASRISVETHFQFNKISIPEETKSNSIVTNLIKDDDGNLKLVFTYENIGNYNQNISPSYGTNILSIIKKQNELQLKGTYYTDRNPIQTKGEMKLTFTTKNLKKGY